MSNPNFQGSSDDVSLSPGQAKFLYWFVGTAPILKAMTPITTYWGILKNKTKELAKTHPGSTKLPMEAYTDIYRSVLSDVSRQTVTCSFQLMSYFVVGDAIKAILKKVYANKSPDKQDMGMQQVLMQVIPLTVQVVATILSRNFGAADLQALFDVNPKTGKLGRLEKEKVGNLRHLTGTFVKKHLKDSTGQLKPLKAAVTGTGAMMAYFGTLVGVLYGISAGLEKAFPGTFKSKQGKGNPAASPNAVPLPARMNLTSPSSPNWPAHQPMRPMMAAYSPSLKFSSHLPQRPMTSLYS